MQLMATTDYAIRMILYLATVGRKASSAEIAEKMEVPRKYLINIKIGRASCRERV